ncbi:hypothetical protein [Streptomyces luteireticuli]|uniref:hypothetical protein n=1 Tax=Streptomyces luteireticuli TaxID=173858 RepID=UPI0031E3142B
MDVALRRELLEELALDTARASEPELSSRGHEPAHLRSPPEVAQWPPSPPRIPGGLSRLTRSARERAPGRPSQRRRPGVAGRCSGRC